MRMRIRPAFLSTFLPFSQPSLTLIAGRLGVCNEGGKLETLKAMSSMNDQKTAEETSAREEMERKVPCSNLSSRGREIRAERTRAK